MEKLWSISALADEFGMARHTVRKRMAAVTPAEHTETRDGRQKKRYRFADAEAILKRRAVKPPSTDPVDLEDINKENALVVRSIEDAKLTRAKAEEMALRVAERRGELIPATIVVEVGAAQIGAARAKLLGVHSKVRSRYPDLDQVIIDDIQELHSEALTELANLGLPPAVAKRLGEIGTGLAAAAEADDHAVVRQKSNPAG